MVFDFFEVGARGGLVAAEAGKPPGVGFEGAHERLDLAEVAAGGGLDDVELAVLAFVLFEREERQGIDEVEVPGLGDAVAVGEELGEVVAGFEEDDGDAGGLLEEMVEDDHVLGLEAGGEAEGGAVGLVENVGDEGRGG